MQGRNNYVSSFEPSLLLMQLLPSPWSSSETLVAVGGWTDFAAPALKKMLTEAPAQGKFFGNLCAMDASGRTAAYDTRRASAEPFAEHLQRKIAPGVSVAETNQRLQREATRSQKVARANNLVLFPS
jgi:hypothetical protein